MKKEKCILDRGEKKAKKKESNKTKPKPTKQKEQQQQKINTKNSQTNKQKIAKQTDTQLGEHPGWESLQSKEGTV